MGRDSFYKLLQGVLPAECWEEMKSSSDFFATAFQLSGFLNLGFSQNFKKSKLQFLRGFPVFKTADVQDNRARVRRLIHACIANGAWMDIDAVMGNWHQGRGNPH